MSFEGEFASYEPLRRIMESKKVAELEKRLIVRHKDKDATNSVKKSIVKKSDLEGSKLQPNYIIAIDGSNLTHPIENGFPGAEFGYITIASVLLKLDLIKQLESNKFIDPRLARKTEDATSIETVFPGCNVILDKEDDAKSSVRKAIYEEFERNRIFKNCESLLDTYEYLFQLKIDSDGKSTPKPKSPIEGYADKDMTYGMGIYKCPHSGKNLYSTDALRLHELLNPSGTSGELYGQIMSTMEKLWLVHILRAFEQNGWLEFAQEYAFVMDGPLAVFSTSSWLTKVISKEIQRINEKQKKVSGVDLLIIGIEKSGTFFNHFETIDTDVDGHTDVFPNQSALLLDDSYIKKNIIYSESTKPYGQDTYFGRKFFYKTKSGQKIVPVACTFTDYQKNLSTAKPDQFPRLADIMTLLDSVVSCRYPNSISPLISAHAEAAIPLNLGKRLFDEIAKEIKERKTKC